MFKSPPHRGLPVLLSITLIGSLGFSVAAQSPPAATLSPTLREFVTFDDPIIALIHVRVIDGTGQPSRPSQTLILREGIIAAIGDATSTSIPAGAKVLDLPDRTVFPGIVGMHDHMFYPQPTNSPHHR